MSLQPFMSLPLDGSMLRASLHPWLQESRPGGGVTNEVQQEAQLLSEILDHIEVVACLDEVRKTFTETPLEAHLAEALVAALDPNRGQFAADMIFAEPRRLAVLESLHAAAEAGSSWALLWMGDLEAGRDAEGWYLEAAARGHPDAARRIAELGLVGGSGLLVGTPSASQAAPEAEHGLRVLQELSTFAAGLAGVHEAASSPRLTKASNAIPADDVIDEGLIAPQNMRLVEDGDQDLDRCGWGDAEDVEMALEQMDDATVEALPPRLRRMVATVRQAAGMERSFFGQGSADQECKDILSMFEQRSQHQTEPREPKRSKL